MSTLGNIALPCAIIAMASCAIEGDDPDPPVSFPSDPAEQLVRVTEISVSENDALNLEVEVHLFDADTGESIGCSGQFEGLDGVDQPNVVYPVLAEFITPSFDLVTLEDVVSRDIIIHVIEDDSMRCPGPITSTDDTIGESGILEGASLEQPQRLGFGSVRQLVIGSSRTRLPE